jgi:hypothetical protein
MASTGAGLLRRRARHETAALGVREVEVEQDDVPRRTGERRAGVGQGRDVPDVEGGEGELDEVRVVRAVLHEQDAQAGRLCVRARSVPAHCRGQDEGDAQAAQRRVRELEHAAVGAHEVARHGEPDARPARAVQAPERLEGLLAALGRDARAVVVEHQADVPRTRRERGERGLPRAVHRAVHEQLGEQQLARAAVGPHGHALRLGQDEGARRRALVRPGARAREELVEPDDARHHRVAAALQADDAVQQVVELGGDAHEHVVRRAVLAGPGAALTQDEHRLGQRMGQPRQRHRPAIGGRAGH